jgi:4-hydroxybenzoate polyprenyltransferase
MLADGERYLGQTLEGPLATNRLHTEEIRMLQKMWAFLSKIRARDIVVFQSPCIAGLVIFAPDASSGSIWRAAVVFLGSFLIIAYVFAFNDWADLELDRQNPHKRERTFVDEGLSDREMLGLSLALAVSGTALVSIVAASLAVVALLIVLIWLAYSFPVRRFYGKGIPVVSSFLHLSGVLLCFLLGSMAFEPIGIRALLIGAYFAIVIAAGHLAQEIQDYAEDRQAGISTNAVWFGRKPAFYASFALLSLAFPLLLVLAQRGFVPAVTAYTILMYPIYVACAAQALSRGLEREAMWQFRSRYRIVFGLILSIMLVAAIRDKLT